MERRSVELTAMKREWHLAPPVTAVNFTDFRYAVRQTVRDVQVAFHTGGTPESVRFEINGTAYTAGYPHLLIKRPGDTFSASPAPSDQTSGRHVFRLARARPFHLFQIPSGSRAGAPRRSGGVRPAPLP